MDTIGERIRAVQQAASSQAMLSATWALANSDHGESVNTEAIHCLVEVLGFNNPGAAVAAVEGLIRLGPAAVQPILDSLDPRNYGARAWAVRALAGIGDVRGLELLEEALGTDVGPSVRRAAACGLGSLRLETLEAPQRLAVRERSLQALLAGCRDGEWVVRYAVSVGLESLGLRQDRRLQERQHLLEALAALGQPEREETAVVRLRARLALQRILALSGGAAEPDPAGAQP
ncbi:MAG: HEAT repeat domain-containing protein [Synechococcaceae cyanobacterium ELA739]